ncbi:hypothetical protein AOQ84DRAFT_351802 [Glonium stellatum]|uniref:Uncharacterized protein n=1 Tax=Glonium stellatum TaxID=574774 RepID=A0A8E2FBF3_9PEZI|nr:hypothetical protein AOQ84DRAFT_351802 [Glonium stellatum]
MTEVYPFNEAFSAGSLSRTLPVSTGMMGCGVLWKAFIFWMNVKLHVIVVFELQAMQSVLDLRGPVAGSGA